VEGIDFTHPLIEQLSQVVSSLSQEMKKVEETYKQQHAKAQKVHQDFFDTMASHEEAKSLISATNDRAYREILDNRKLDPESTVRLQIPPSK
jgi:hypothetical protein